MKPTTTTNGSRPSSPLPGIRKKHQHHSRTTKRKKTRKHHKFAAKIRKNPCFRAFLLLITLQTFILFLIVLFVGDDFPQAISSRAHTLLLVRDYYVNHLSHYRRNDDDSLQLPPGIVMEDDDDVASTSPQEAEEAAHWQEEQRDDDLHKLEDHLANQTEERLNQLQHNDIPLQQQQQPALDNYYERQGAKPHTHDDDESHPFSFLIVGGSDGSGTRAFVTALGKLGVPMIVDDKGTMDVHGKPLFDKQGWPPLVQLVLNHTHSANYEVDDLPLDVQTTILEELTKLQKDLVKRGVRYNKKQLTQQQHMKHRKVNHYPNNNKRLRPPATAYGHIAQDHRALLEQQQAEEQEDVPEEFNLQAIQALNHSKLVQFGWKAPVSMLLLPFLRQVFGPIKFLHVVRDGRDVALSANQSPVKKFYNSYYNNHNPQDWSKLPQNDTSMNVRAMELWNDWNLQVLEYEQAHAQDDDFDYLIMRTEDLLDPQHKFASLQQLAHFVGSRKSLQELCCQSQQAVVDMGQSSANMGDGNRKKRTGPHIYDKLFGKKKKGNHKPREKTDYGNWLATRRQDEELEEQIHQVLASAGSSSSEAEQQQQHGVMGADPILGFAHGQHVDGDWNANNQFFDREEGRHRNWHHGEMNAGHMVEDARQRRMDDLRKRNERYKGLARRVADVYHKRRPQQEHNHQPDAEAAVDGGGDEHRRRLLSKFNKLQIRRNPYRAKKKKEEEEEKGPHEPVESHDTRSKKQHRQFKPRLHSGEPVLRGPRAKEPAGGKPGTAWSLTSSLSQAFRFPSQQQKNDDEPTKSEMAREVLEKFQRMPLKDIVNTVYETPSKLEEEEEEGLPTLDMEPNRHGRKKKKAGNVKARYGKWVGFLEDKPELSHQVHEIGARALEAFGYEPSAPFLDTSGVDDVFQCGSDVVCEDNGSDNEDGKQKAKWRERRDERMMFVH